MHTLGSAGPRPFPGHIPRFALGRRWAYTCPFDTQTPLLSPSTFVKNPPRARPGSAGGDGSQRGRGISWEGPCSGDPWG